MPWSGDYGDNYLVAGDVSRRLLRSGNFILEGEVGVGYRFPQVNAGEGWAALFLRYDGFFWNHIVFTTVAISTGLSYVEKVSDVEKDAVAIGAIRAARTCCTTSRPKLHLPFLTTTT
jgi:hypothetical protein